MGMVPARQSYSNVNTGSKWRALPRPGKCGECGSNHPRTADDANNGLSCRVAQSRLRMRLPGRGHGRRQPIVGAMGPSGLGRCAGTAALVHARRLALRSRASTRPSEFRGSHTWMAHRRAPARRNRVPTQVRVPRGVQHVPACGRPTRLVDLCQLRATRREGDLAAGFVSASSARSIRPPTCCHPSVGRTVKQERAEATGPTADRHEESIDRPLFALELR